MFYIIYEKQQRDHIISNMNAPSYVVGQQPRGYPASSDYHIRPGEALCFAGAWDEKPGQHDADGNHLPLADPHNYGGASSAVVRTRGAAPALGNYTPPSLESHQ